MRTMLLVGVVGLVASLAVGLAPDTPAVAAAVAPGTTVGVAESGLTVVSDEALSERLHEITVESTALEGQTTLRVLLPAGYDPNGDVDHPVLFLLHGCCDDYRSWADKTDLEEFTADLDVIVVMPDAGAWGFYTDWFNNGAFGQPKWESYHIGELVPWVSERYDACDKRSCRIVIGLSMGGFGSMSYAARHPDLFVAAAAFSGAVDTNVREPAGGIAVSLLELALGEVPPGSLWGQYATEEVRWRGDNPWDLAPNLANTEVELRTGNGQPGGEYGGGPDGLEAGVHEMMVSLHDHLTSLEIEHVWDDYGPGAHDWPYWQRDLHLTLPTFLDVIAEQRPDPIPFSVRRIEPTFEVYGWEVALDRPVLEFAELRDASPDGFTLVGSGAATVTTAPWFDPDSTYDVTVADATTSVTADAAGRLTIPVDLGPAHEFQQHTPEATVLETALGDAYFTTAEVTITPAEDQAPTDGAPDADATEPSAPDTADDGLPATGGGLVVGGLMALAALGVRDRRRGRRDVGLRPISDRGGRGRRASSS